MGWRGGSCGEGRGGEGKSQRRAAAGRAESSLLPPADVDSVSTETRRPIAMPRRRT